MSNAVSLIPQGLQLPAHLQDANIAAQIAAENAAAAGGIKAGGFPSISIKANKFHIKDGDEITTLMSPPAQPGQPALPMMCLEVVVVAGNPALSKVYYAHDFVEGEPVSPPTCKSTDGIRPDPGVEAPQSDACATCKQNQWGSKISKFSGKEIKACSDSKQLVVLPAGDLDYKALGLSISPGSLGNWGAYVKALSGRGYGVTTLVTNVTFDATQNGVLNFGFNRFLTADEFAKVRARATGDDVLRIVTPPITAPALPAPASVASLPPATPPATPAAQPAVSGFGAAPVAPTPVPAAAQPAATVGFGAAPAAPAPAAQVAPEAPKRVRRTRAQIEADNAAAAQAAPVPPVAAMPPAAPAADPSLAHLPLAIQTAVLAVGKDSPAGQALLAQFMAPTQAPTQPPASAPAPVGFGAAPPAPAQPGPSAAAVSSGASLRDILAAKLGRAAPPAAG